jgi:prevent-host-death family protein
MRDHVGIAELKSRLSEYLRAVRKGRHLTVLDRDRPIARIVPYQAGTTRLEEREPAGKVERPADVPLPPPLRLDVDVVALLLEEREER